MWDIMTLVPPKTHHKWKRRQFNFSHHLKAHNCTYLLASNSIFWLGQKSLNCDYGLGAASMFSPGDYWRKSNSCQFLPISSMTCYNEKKCRHLWKCQGWSNQLLQSFRHICQTSLTSDFRSIGYKTWAIALVSVLTFGKSSCHILNTSYYHRVVVNRL